MNNDLKRINGYLFQSYVGDNFPLYSETSYGHFVIVDNTGPINIQGLIPNTYNVFVDHIHIASGYGFGTVDDFNNEMKRITYAYNGVIDLYEYNKNNENTTLFNLQMVDNGRNNHFASYNAYGFETSYRMISVNQTVSEDYKYNYELKVNKYDLNYINPIEVKFVQDSTEDITSVYKTEDFPLNIKITTNVSDDNDEVFNSLVVHESIKINGKQLGNSDISVGGGFNTYFFDFNTNTNKYVEDLKVEYLYYNNVLSTYIIPGILKWTEKMFIYPTLYAMNKVIIYNDDPEDIEHFIGQNIAKLYNDSSSNPDLINNSTLYINPNELISVDFNSGSNFLYDYIVILEDFIPEFYYNGIKSENWQIITQSIKDYNESEKTNNIWRSPQKYSGLHTWQIQLKPRN